MTVTVGASGPHSPANVDRTASPPGPPPVLRFVPMFDSRLHPARVFGLAAALVLGAALAATAPTPARATPWTWGDTLTTILRPLPNLPSIVRPGADTLVVWAAGPPTITGWRASMLYGTIQWDLFPAGGGFNASTNRWELRFTVPQLVAVGTSVDLPYEVYDLVLNSDQTLPDTSRHAVDVIPNFETSFYFAQISDTHLPSHKFSSDAGFSTSDTTGFADFNAVAEDLNLIHPQFIIHTGDLVNEGELEDYLSMFEMSRAKAALSRFREPVWVSTGNHDIGGWKPTPPPDGTSRKLWWKLFGWPFLENPPAGDPYHSQDYSFDYGLLHAIGLEAYINNGSYDSYNTPLYGAQSFTPEQMGWLAANIAATPPGHAKLLFYHYDFGGTLGNGSPGANFSQINPAALGIDGAIWGHNHVVAEGNRAAKPFNLGLQSVIDYRAFRLFRVVDGVITPGPMHHSGGIATAPTDSIVVGWNAANDGSATSLTATVFNRFGEGFEHCRLVFHMQPGFTTYQATGGTVAQDYDNAGMHDVEVDFNAPPSFNTQVTVNAFGGAAVPPAQLAGGVRLSAPSPNPWRRGAAGGGLAVSFALPARAEGVDLALYDVRGRRVATLAHGALDAGPHVARLHAADAPAASVRPGVYFLRLSALGALRMARVAILE